MAANASALDVKYLHFYEDIPKILLQAKGRFLFLQTGLMIINQNRCGITLRGVRSSLSASLQDLRKQVVEGSTRRNNLLILLTGLMKHLTPA